MGWVVAIPAKGQKKSWGPSRSHSKHESAAALQAGEDSLCVDSSWNANIYRGKKAPIGTRREVILPHAMEQAGLASAFQSGVSDFEDVMENLEKTAFEIMEHKKINPVRKVHDDSETICI